MKEAKRVFITDCEGPISKNDNAFELTKHFIPEGEHFFTQLSRYDDILAYVAKRKGYNAGDTLKLIVPFLKAYGATNEKMAEFSTQNILLMPSIKDTLQFIQMPSFIISTSYEHYIKALCNALDFPYKNTYCTLLNINSHSINKAEQKKLKEFRQQICELPLIEPFKETDSLIDLSETDQRTIEYLDDIFWEKVTNMVSGDFLREVKPIGGVEKVRAAENIVENIGTNLGDVIYIGDSITDVECFRLVRKNGGVTISFNGNEYAVREADVTILSNNTLVIAVIAQVFGSLGPDSVYNLVDNWKEVKLSKYKVTSALMKKVDNTFPHILLEINRITDSNVEQLVKESSLFRKRIRGEIVGKLG